jgi:hypothetical protein
VFVDHVEERDPQAIGGGMELMLPVLLFEKASLS